MKAKFHRIVVAQQGRVLALALRLLQSRAEAEDAMQEVFTRLWQHIAAVEEGAAGGWLQVATRNACFDVLRRRQRWPEEDETVLQALADDVSPLRVLEQSRLGQWLQDKIGALAEPYRSLLIMAEVQQLTHSDIAARTRLNPNQVKVYVHRARLQLRALAEVEAT